MKYVFLLSALALTACGEKGDGDEGDKDEPAVGEEAGDPATEETPPEEPAADSTEGKTKLTIFERTLYVDDELYDLSCSGIPTKFALSGDGECVAVTNVTGVADDLSQTWLVKTAEGRVILSGAVGDDGKLTVAGDPYFCFLYTGRVYIPGSDDFHPGDHIVVANKPATKPSDLKPGSIFAVLGRHEDFCEALQ